MSLREKAEAAEPGPWTTGVSGNELRVKTEREGWRVCDLNHGPTAEFIAAADPPTVLALLDERDALRAELAYALNCQPQFFPAEATPENCERLRRFRAATELLARGDGRG